MKSNAPYSGSVSRAFSAMLFVWGAMLLGSLPAAPAMAQAIDTVDVRATLLGELSLLKTEDLDFGNIAGLTAGSVTMTSTAAPTCTSTPGLVHSGECQPATFIGKGQNGRIVRIKKPTSDRITLTGPGAPMTITNLVLNGTPGLTTIQQTPGFSRFRISSPTGFFTFRLGGRLNVGANQQGGLYTGTFVIEINYD